MPGFTAQPVEVIFEGVLWIDYILYFYARLYSAQLASVHVLRVVNWLHFVFLCPALQLRGLKLQFVTGCELITFCIFMPGFTANFSVESCQLALWIDYILYFYARLYSAYICVVLRSLVVNWLHFVFLCPALQPCQRFQRIAHRCELITFCIFMPGFTAFAFCIQP